MRLSVSQLEHTVARPGLGVDCASRSLGLGWDLDHAAEWTGYSGLFVGQLTMSRGQKVDLSINPDRFAD